MEDCPQGLRDCRDPALGLEMFLKERSGELRGKEENEASLGFDAERLNLVSKGGAYLPPSVTFSAEASTD